jgi:pyridinium-3,5-biscarboxylic acid mononucleotide synthase
MRDSAAGDVQPSLDLGFATLDLDRSRRQGLPEVVYGTGKTADEIVEIVASLVAETAGPVLATRIETDAAAGIIAGVAVHVGHRAHHDPAARTICWRPAARRTTNVMVVTAGTADGPVADEAAAVAAAAGLHVRQIRDVGVAGIQRLLDRVDEIRASDIVIVIAGMEGALASVVAGLVAGPVIAVPTSTGYGAALDGITALLAMMSSCANGVTVVNIDSGFAAAMAAHRLAIAIETRSS